MGQLPLRVASCQDSLTMVTDFVYIYIGKVIFKFSTDKKTNRTSLDGYCYSFGSYYAFTCMQASVYNISTLLSHISDKSSFLKVVRRLRLLLEL